MGTPHSCSARPPGSASRSKLNRPMSTRSCAARARTGSRLRAPRRCSLTLCRLRFRAVLSQMAIDAQASAQPIILGAQTLPDAHVTLKIAPGAPLNLDFNLASRGEVASAWGRGPRDRRRTEVPGRRCFQERGLRAPARLGEPRRAAVRGQGRSDRPSAPLPQRIALGSGRSLSHRILWTQSQADAGSHGADRRACLQGAGGRRRRSPRRGPRKRFARRRRAAEPRRSEDDRRYGLFDFA